MSRDLLLVFGLTGRMSYKDFGKRITEARLALAPVVGKNVSPSALARAMGVSEVTVGRWERGEKEPGLERFARLAAVLGVTPEWLVFGAGERSSGQPPAFRDPKVDQRGRKRARTTEAPPTRTGLVPTQNPAEAEKERKKLGRPRKRRA